MTLIFNNLVPGQLASRESVERGLLWGPIDSVVTAHAVISSTTVDARSTVTTDLQAGLVLGKITSTGELAHYLPTATDGTQVAVGVLAHPLQMLNPSNAAADQLGLVVVAGPVRQAQTGGLDQFARANLFGRIIFDDDFRGNNFGVKDVVAKTANYTVVAADNGTVFTNQGAGGAVTFTLPTIAKGLRYRFFVEAGQNVTVASAVADTMVVFNDAAADSIAFSTAAELIGQSIEVLANADATKWLVIVSLGAETATPTIAT